MPLGDSITYGIGSPTHSSYRMDLHNRMKYGAGIDLDFVGSQKSGAYGDIENEGHPGYRIDQIAAGVDGWLATYRPDVVLLMIGTNDMNENHQVATAPQRLGALIDKIRADRPDATVLVSKLPASKNPAVQARIDAYNAALPGIVASRGSHVKLVQMPALPPGDYADTLHPNDAGYREMSQGWYDALVPALTGHTLRPS